MNICSTLSELKKCLKTVNEDTLPRVNDQILPKIDECVDQASTVISMIKNGAAFGGTVAIFCAAFVIWKRCFPPPPPPPPRGVVVLLYPPSAAAAATPQVSFGYVTGI